MPEGQNRKLKLSSVTVYPKTASDCGLSVDEGSNVGDTRVKFVDMVTAICQAHQTHERPEGFEVTDSVKHPGDVILLPVAKATEDDIEVTWMAARRATLDLSKLFTLKGISVPPGSRMFIEAYTDTDADWGAVIGLKLSAKQFHPKARRKKDPPPEASNQ